MRGQRPSGEDYEILGRGSIILREGLYFLVWFGVWVDCYRGALGCWEFWARGPGILTKSRS